MKGCTDEVYAVVAVEYGDSVDGKGRVIRVTRDRESARSYMAADARQYAESHGLEYTVYDDSASVGATDECGCEYLIQGITCPKVA